MQRLARRLSLSDRIVWSGNLGPAEMGWCYQHARAFAMTSRAEACPNIGLEALSYGAQIISTNHPPMPQVFGSAARYYPQYNYNILGQELSLALNRPAGEEAQLRQAARARAAGFSWQSCANQTIEQFAETIRDYQSN